LNIVIVSDYAERSGGAEKVAIDSAVALARAGEQVHFLSAVGPIDPELQEAGVTVHLAGIQDLKRKNKVDLVISGLWSRRCAALAAELLAKLPKGESIVHVHTWQRALTSATLRACRESGHPLLLTLHDYGTACPNQGFFDYQRGEICTRRALGPACLSTHCDTRTYAHKLWRTARIAVQSAGANVPLDLDDVIYMSELSRQVLTPYFSEKTRWHSVPNPIFTPHDARVPAESNRAFLFVGRIEPHKGVDLLAEAGQNAHVPVTIVGDGPDLPELKRRFPEVTYTGWLRPERTRELMQTARALVFPSRWYEVQPLVVQEALACGVPVIAADRTSAREAVSDQQTGLLFRHMDASDLEQKLRVMAQSDELVAGLSRTAYERYWSNPPTIERHIDTLRAVYRDCLGRGTSAAHA
jgi:glycosyltransferase involved in cell wall biosynthesis